LDGEVAVARLHRQELKHDEFVDSVDELLLYLEDNWRTLVALGVAVLLLGGALAGLYAYSERAEHQAERALGEALIVLEAPVQPGLPALNVPGAQRTFTSEREKYEAAKKKFIAVRENYPGARAALLAKHYEADCRFELGETAPATAAMEELSRAADTNEAALASFHLAGFYEAQGRSADAEPIYRRLAAHPADTVPRPLAVLALARLLSPSNPAEARQLLTGLKADYPTGQIGAEATQLLDRLPAPTPEKLASAGPPRP
jgi:predicted negative regulator of RcsB-dependent stress response